MKSRVDAHNARSQWIVGVTALQSVFLVALLVLAGYDGAHEPRRQPSHALSAAGSSAAGGAVGTPDGIRQLLAPDQSARSKARLLDPPDLDLCRAGCIFQLPVSSAFAALPADPLFLLTRCCAFQPRAPPATIA